MSTDQSRDSFGLAGRTAIVIGAASGIGASITEELVRAGAAVVTVDISPTVDEMPARLGASVVASVRADVTDEATIGAALAVARELRGQATILVHSAFIESATLLEETDTAAWRRTLEVLLTSAWHCDVQFVRGLEGREGSIVHIASVHSLATAPKYGAYAAAKAGVLGLTRSAAIEWGPRGVRVNAVCPGFIKVDRNAFVWKDEATLASLLRCYPLGRPGLPADVANAVRFLCSPAASYINGVTLPVDGGMLALVPEAVTIGR